MEYFHNEQNSSRLIQTISDAPTEKAYPVAAYTYLVVNTSTSPKIGCDQMIEFVGYVTWFLNNTYAHQVARMNSMVSLSKRVSNSVIERVLKQITCKNQNVYEAMLRQIEEENRPSQIIRSDLSTAIIVLISALALSCIIFPILLFVYYRQRILKNAINKKDWFIDQSRFKSIEEVRDMNESSLAPTHHSENSLFTTIAWADKPGLAMLCQCAQHNPDENFSAETLKFIIRCRKQLDHLNVTQFVGVTVMNKSLYQVSIFYFFPTSSPWEDV